MVAQVREGLLNVLSDVPVRSGFLEVVGGLTRNTGAFARIEGGYRPHRDVGLFAQAEWNQFNPYAGIGARWQF